MTSLPTITIEPTFPDVGQTKFPSRLSKCTPRLDGVLLSKGSLSKNNEQYSFAFIFPSLFSNANELQSGAKLVL